MGFPDRIERTVEVAHPPGTVWAALTTAAVPAPFGADAGGAAVPGRAGPRLSSTPDRDYFAPWLAL